MADEVLLGLGVELDQSGIDKGLKEAQETANNNPLQIKLNLRDIETAKKEINTLLKGNMEGIPESFELIKREINYIDKGAFKGLYKSVENFANGTDEARQRVIYFKQEADGSFKAINGSVQKSVEHLSNYQQAMELTAKKLSVVNKEVERSPVFNESGIMTGWETITTTLMSSGQELKTIVTETEELGVATKKVHQEMRQFDKETGELIEDWHKFGEDSTETINLRDQAEQKYINTLLKEKSALEEIHKFQGREPVKDKNGEYVLDDDGHRTYRDFESTWKTIEDRYGNKYQTIVKKYQDELGNTIEETTARVKQQGKAWKDLGVISKKVSSDEVAEAKKLKAEQDKLNKQIQDRVTTNNEYKKNIKGISHTIKEQTVETKNFAGETQKTRKIVDEYKDSMGRLVTTTTKYDAENRKTTETMIQMGKQAKHLGQSFSDVIVKVAKFYVASLPIRAVQNAITQAVQSVKDFDSAITEFKKVSDLSGKSLDEYCEKLEKLGELTARGRTEMVQMATEFKRSGYSDEDAAKLAQISSLYQNIADEELSASDASSVLISQMKAFQKQGIEAEHVIDAINEV